MKNILITGIGGPTPRSIARAVRDAFPSYKIIGIDANPKALGFFMPGLIDKAYRAPKVTESGYWPFVQKLIKEESIDVAFVQPEKEVIGWGEYFKTNGNYPCPVLLPPLEYANALVDKVKMSAILKETDYIPKTISFDITRPDYFTHPVSKMDFIGFEILYWKDIVLMCEKAALFHVSKKSLNLYAVLHNNYDIVHKNKPTIAKPSLWSGDICCLVKGGRVFLFIATKLS